MTNLNPNEFIILRFPPIDDNISYIDHTFAIMQYIFYDDRFLTKYIKDNNPEKFNIKYYEEFMEKCLKINDRIEINFTVKEFAFLVKIIDFVSKCFIGEPNEKIKQVINECSDL